jgi:hypothetical protein
MEQAAMAQVAQMRRWEHVQAKNFDLRVARQRIRNLEIELEEADDTEKFWTLHHRNSPRKLGKRPAVRKFKTGKSHIHMQDFNLLKVPQLPDTRRTQREEFTLSTAMQQVTGSPPRYVWL